MSVLAIGAATVAATVAFLPADADRSAAGQDQLGAAAATAAGIPRVDESSDVLPGDPAKGAEWSPEAVAEPECDRSAGQAIAGRDTEPVLHTDPDPDAEPGAEGPPPIAVTCADPEGTRAAAGPPSPPAVETAANG